MRCSSVKIEAGGGGINVAKALVSLGMDAQAILASGGRNGDLLMQLLRQNRIVFHAVAAHGTETRENLTLFENTTGKQYRFVMPSDAMPDETQDEMLDLLESIRPFPLFIVASGSLPRGFGEDFFARIVESANRRGIRCAVDTSGTALRHAVAQRPYLIKPNLSELAELTGQPKLTRDTAEAAARSLVESGACKIVVVSFGAEGALLVSHDFSEYVAAPAVKKLSTVGAGDSLVAGIIHMLVSGATLSEAIRFGVACGTAATMNAGSELFHAEDARQLYRQMPAEDSRDKVFNLHAR